MFEIYALTKKMHSRASEANLHVYVSVKKYLNSNAILIIYDGLFAT